VETDVQIDGFHKTLLSGISKNSAFLKLRNMKRRNCKIKAIVALQVIFAALGPFSSKRKSNIDLLPPEIWSKTVNKSIKRPFFSASPKFIIYYLE